MDVARLSNVLLLERDYSGGRSALAGRPFEAYIEVSARCNLRCPMCPITVDPRYAPHSGRPALLSPDLFDRLEAIVPTLHRAHLFGLGEPVLNPHLPHWVERLTRAGVEVWTTTNATLIDASRAEALAQAGLARITVSIDAASKGTYERIRRQGRFEDAIAGVRALAAARRRHGRPRLFFSMIAMASNLAELPALIDLCAEVGGDGVYLEELYRWPDPSIETFCDGEHLGLLPPERVDELLAEAGNRARAKGLEWACRLAERAAYGTQTAPAIAATSANGVPPAAAAPDATGIDPALPFACSEPWTTINVSVDGDVRTCCFNDTSFGSLRTAPIDAIWSGDAYRALREDHAAGRTPSGCAGCVLLGRAKRSPFFTGSSDARPEFPEAAPADVSLDTPAAGEIVGGTLVLSGSLSPQKRGRERPTLADVYIDETFVGSLEGDRGSGHFAEVVPVPYVTAGKHWLSLRSPGAGPDGPSRESREIQVLPVLDSETTLAGVRRVSAAVRLDAVEPEPVLRIDGRPHALLRWVCRRKAPGWLAVAVFSVETLSPGLHECELVFRGAATWRKAFWRLPLE